MIIKHSSNYKQVICEKWAGSWSFCLLILFTVEKVTLSCASYVAVTAQWSNLKKNSVQYIIHYGSRRAGLSKLKCYWEDVQLTQLNPCNVSY